jgi:hypothetical protein
LSCDGPRTVADVRSEQQPRLDGRPDRKVEVVRDCGHVYFWSGPLDAPVPTPGEPAMRCLGPIDATFHRAANQPDGPAIFDERKRAVRHLRPRKDVA